MAQRKIKKCLKGERNMQEMKNFKNEEFGKVRTRTIDNETLFAGKDVAKALGYGDEKSLSNVVAKHVGK